MMFTDRQLELISEAVEDFGDLGIDLRNGHFSVFELCAYTTETL